MFDFFHQSSKAYTKRAQLLLIEARFAQLEHEAAAEHHYALAQMYAARVQRLEAPLATELQRSSPISADASAATSLEMQRAPLRVLKPTSSQAVAG